MSRLYCSQRPRIPCVCTPRSQLLVSLSFYSWQFAWINFQLVWMFYCIFFYQFDLILFFKNMPVLGVWIFYCIFFLSIRSYFFFKNMPVHGVWMFYCNFFLLIRSYFFCKNISRSVGGTFLIYCVPALLLWKTKTMFIWKAISFLMLLIFVVFTVVGVSGNVWTFYYTFSFQFNSHYFADYEIIQTLKKYPSKIFAFLCQIELHPSYI